MCGIDLKVHWAPLKNDTFFLVFGILTQVLVAVTDYIWYAVDAIGMDMFVILFSINRRHKQKFTKRCFPG